MATKLTDQDQRQLEHALDSHMASMKRRITTEKNETIKSLLQEQLSNCIQLKAKIEKGQLTL